MAFRLIPGQKSWEGTRDDKAYREYKITFRVVSDSSFDGPANAMNTPGLPLYGAEWIVDDDLDLYAWCKWDCEAKEVITSEPNKQFDVTFTFTTKPPERWCVTSPIQDPVLEPPKISGSFQKYQEEALNDIFGAPIRNSSFEQIRGPQNEWDKNRLSVTIEQNVASSTQGYVLPAIFMDCVNQFPLWGLPPRTIKLSNAPWTLKFYGICYPYYTRTLTFDIRLEGFDRDIADEGFSVLNGRWDVPGGSGAMVNVTVDATGAITGGTVTAGGTGYPALTVLQLQVTGGDGKGVVSVVINGSGNANLGAVYIVTNPGSNYVAGVTATTPTGLQWLLNAGPNGPPNHTDPKNYILYKDQNGDKKSVILNGAGVPAGIVPLGQFPIYVSTASNNLNGALTNAAFWYGIAGPFSPVPYYSGSITYSKGNLVLYNGEYYVCIRNATQNITPSFSSTQGPFASWMDIGSQVPTYQGTWQPTTTYNEGDIVTHPQAPGKIHVQKYQGADLALLGIPLSF